MRKLGQPLDPDAFTDAQAVASTLRHRPWLSRDHRQPVSGVKNRQRTATVQPIVPGTVRQGRLGQGSAGRVLV